MKTLRLLFNTLRLGFLALLLTMLPVLQQNQFAADASPMPVRPNIVFVLCDDLGYGDVRCFNPDGKILTPHLDRLAAQGMRFTDMHSPSSVCSPTRYSLLTGRYNWRSRLQSGVLGGLSPRLIEEGRLTVAELLRRQGYHTAAIGKWHLGMDWSRLPGRTVNELGIETAAQNRNVDYTQPIKNCPNVLGFDYYFGISASLDMVPYTFIENDRVILAPTVEKSFPMTLGIEARRTRLGPAAPEFDAGDVLPALTSRGVEYISDHAAAARSGNPFFLYVPLNSPHTPILPAKEWQGRSGISPYADFVMQTDASIGEILAAIDRHGLASNTLVIATSDNGCSPEANFKHLAAAGHHPSERFRGAKADIFDGGHRVPFIARWPGRVASGTTNASLFSLMDFMATCADLLDVKLPPNAGEDSVSFLPSLLGYSGALARTELVHHSINGSFAIRQGQWKLEVCPDSGGWSQPTPDSPGVKDLPPVQLYDLSADPGETNNLQGKHPDIVASLTSLLERQIASGRSTPGPPQTNTVQVKIRKKAVNPPNELKSSAGTQYILFNRAPGQGMNQIVPETLGIKQFREVLAVFPNRPEAQIQTGLSYIFSCFRTPPETTIKALKEFLAAAEQTETPVLVQVDTEHWWDARPDLWNWWDPAIAGFNPSNRGNVEWTGWSPEKAIKIAWRNWGQQIRVLPPPNLASERYTAACREEIQRLASCVVEWHGRLPQNKKHLLIGIKLGHETSIGVNAYHYPAGNDLLARPASEDPVRALNTDDVLARGMAQIGFAALTASGVRTGGVPTESELRDVAQRYLEMLCREAVRSGLPRERLFAHGAGWKEGEMIYDVPVNPYACPAWSFYNHAADPRKDAGVQRNLAKSDAPYWAATEWLLQGTLETDAWQSALANTLSDSRCRYVCIFNWESIRASESILKSINKLVNRTVNRSMP